MISRSCRPVRVSRSDYLSVVALDSQASMLPLSFEMLNTVLTTQGPLMYA